MTRVLFVCHGNICRSPLAEFVMKELVRQRGLERAFFIGSAATSDEELGNPIYPYTVQTMRQHKIPFSDHRATQLRRADYDKYDYLIGMDSWNLSNMRRILGSDPQGKIARLLDFTDSPRDVADPWMTRQFEVAYTDILRGCQGLLAHILDKGLLQEGTKITGYPAKG